MMYLLHLYTVSLLQEADGGVEGEAEWTELSSRASLTLGPRDAAQHSQRLYEHPLDQLPVVRETQAAEALDEHAMALRSVAARGRARKKRTADLLFPAMVLDDAQVQLDPNNVPLVQRLCLGAGERANDDVTIVESPAERSSVAVDGSRPVEEPAAVVEDRIPPAAVKR
ncbi:hypothetical protein GUITHDRAFT_152250, partial [Guillardia theta CCMP2712]